MGEAGELAAERGGGGGDEGAYCPWAATGRREVDESDCEDDGFAADIAAAGAAEGMEEAEEGGEIWLKVRVTFITFISFVSFIFFFIFREQRDDGSEGGVIKVPVTFIYAPRHLYLRPSPLFTPFITRSKGAGINGS